MSSSADSSIRTAVLCQALLIAAALHLFAGAVAMSAQEVDIPKLMFQPSANLVLSVGDVAASKEFYGEVLGIKPMADLNLPGGFKMTRYQVGTTEIKFLHNPQLEKTETGKLDAANGIRRLTLHFPDLEALVERFKSHGRAEPAFETDPSRNDWHRALVSDPDGNEIELVVPASGASNDLFDSIELRLTVADLERSRKFYRDFVGFEELPPRDAPEPGGGKLYGYRHGNTTITLGTFGDSLPTHAGRWEEAHGIRYIQYIVTNLDAVDAFARSSGQTIEQEIFPLGNLARIMFVADPDGIINEFVGPPKLN